MKAARQIMLLLILVPLLVSNAEADPPDCDTLGPWSEPVNLGPPINTDASEASATVCLVTCAKEGRRFVRPAPR